MRPVANIDTRDGFTWCNRNGTFLRVLIVRLPGEQAQTAAAIDVRIERLIVLTAPSVEALDEQTESLRAIASAEDIELVSADGHHRALVTRIAATNGTCP